MMIEFNQRLARLSSNRRRLFERRLRSHLPTDGLVAGHSLVAYVVLEEGCAFDEDKTREYLCSRLPEHMVPSLLSQIEAIPLTPSGKSDRVALAQLTGFRAESTRGFTPPRTDMQREVAEAWKQVLGVDRVSLDDSFFELGGHSLLVIQLQTKLQDALNMDVSVVDLFKYPTVNAQAEAISAQRSRLDIANEDAVHFRVQDRAALSRRKQSQLRRASGS